MSACSCGAPLAVAFCGSTISRQRLVVDVDELERVLRLVPALGDDDGDAVADVAHDVFGQLRIRGDLQVGSSATATRTGIGFSAASVSAAVNTATHAGRLFRARRVDRA